MRALVIFGARWVICKEVDSALYKLHTKNLLPNDFKIIVPARRDPGRDGRNDWSW